MCCLRKGKKENKIFFYRERSVRFSEFLSGTSYLLVLFFKMLLFMLPGSYVVLRKEIPPCDMWICKDEAQPASFSDRRDS